MKKFIVMILILTLSLSLLSAITATQIVEKMDELETYKTSFSSGVIISKDRFGEKTSTFNAYSKGAYDSLIEFTSIMEKGQKVLRTEGELYL
ncbi:MAG: outer membrane lipoprotein-sorting protein, partial [Spirochaetia bacterium]|nr:outer membrane lipoprotein-sorting protein [Spirochaetia bacterium]